MDDYGYHWKGMKLTNNVHFATLLLNDDNTESQYDCLEDVANHKHDGGLLGIEFRLSKSYEYNVKSLQSNSCDLQFVGDWDLTK